MLVDSSRFDLEFVYLGESTDRLTHAEVEGLKSVPALKTAGQMIHSHHGADVSAVNGWPSEKTVSLPIVIC